MTYVDFNNDWGWLKGRIVKNTFIVDSLYVRPVYRRRGIGSFFLSLIPKHLDVELAAISLQERDAKNTVGEAALRRFYWKNGFRNARKKVLSNLLRRKGKR